MRSRVVGGAIALGVLLFSWIAAADGTPPDIVRLRNGGMLRGTIVELKPGETVEILLLNGETRKIPMADVEYAGPAETPPEEPMPAPEPLGTVPVATAAITH